METDWLIVRRIAAELERELRGSRVLEAGSLADGRFGLRLARRTVAIDAFGQTPCVLLEDQHELERVPGWPRALHEALEGMRVDRVRGRRGDRLIAFELSARSRFGVASRVRLVIELTPRFGNIVLLKDDAVVAAAKEFPRSEGARRATVAGEPYEPPPLPAPPDAGDPADAFAALARGEAGARERAVRALRGAVRLLPKLPAESLVAEAAALGAGAATFAGRALERARALTEAGDEGSETLDDVFVYAERGGLVQVHVVPLAQFAAYETRREARLLPLLSQALGERQRARAEQAFWQRRAALQQRLERRLQGLRAERTALERERDDEAALETLRNAGELLYAHLTDVPPGADRFVPPSDPQRTIELDPALDAKANAAAFFKRYRKALGRRSRLAERIALLERDCAYADELLWELERVEPQTLAELVEAVERLERRTPPASSLRAATARPREALEVPLSADARVYVGRSPRNNAELTFRLARPNDLWFHARATPGAHVVLRIDSQRNPSADELAAAAALAAHHSKAHASDKVAVDYTERKHVRRQQGAPPGAVWYTHARTLLVAPRG